ncbi:hypothetical protein ACJIZ3_003457 [Penstemon smallii]|uniref:HMA domain-containing protein n=1 Tax=Penstemon smallii TaxID=265156 RepID=A0ABD3U9A3_9LAMI
MENMQIVPAGKNVEAQYVEMMVPLYSYGCEKKVKKALANLKVTVWGICDKHDVLCKVKSKRKGARFWDDEDNAQIDQESHSAPPSPQSTSLPKKSKLYLAMIKSQSLNLNLTMLKGRSLNWKALKKAFTRSNSF